MNRPALSPKEKKKSIKLINLLDGDRALIWLEFKQYYILRIYFDVMLFNY